jgi:hypothetical protein
LEEDAAAAVTTSARLPKLRGVLLEGVLALAALLRHDDDKGKQEEVGKGRKALASGAMLLAKSAAIKATVRVEVMVLDVRRLLLLLLLARGAASCCCILLGLVIGRRSDKNRSRQNLGGRAVSDLWGGKSEER